MKLLTLLSIIFLTIFISCNTRNENTARTLVKFEPENGKCILFVGQDLGAIGGVEGYDKGYIDHFGRPGGFTMYTNLRTGDQSFDHTYRGLDGIWETDNWGSGDCNMNVQLNDANFENMALAIGFELVNNEEKVATGEKDNLLDSMAVWLTSLSPRPVFLRIGYEFDGHEWNHYNREDYLDAFRYIHTRFDSLGVNNVAYVWQSKGWGADLEELARWYPGDDYVDWCAYSFFSRGADGQSMIDFARAHTKPVFIAEATPVFEADSETLECDMDIPEQANLAREEWFSLLFKTIDKNPDVVKAVSYINVDWRIQDMWQTPPFNMCDSRIQQNDLLSEFWMKEIKKDKYIKASSNLYKLLWHEDK